MSCPCSVGDRTYSLTVEGLETERPRLVRTVSRTNQNVRSPLPRAVNRVGINTNDENPVQRSGSGVPSEVEPGVETEKGGIAGHEETKTTSREDHVVFGATIHPKGILRQPTKEFPFEDGDQPRPHIAKKSPRNLRIDGSKVPASDVVKVHAYRRRGLPVNQDRDSSLAWDKAPISEADTLLGKTLAPEPGPTHRSSNDRNNSNVSKGRSRW